MARRFRHGTSLDRVARLVLTIRARILIAFLIMTAITAALGSFAVVRLQEVGQLMTRTYDQSLMSVNYARAAAADFAAMENAFIRCSLATDPAEVGRLRQSVGTLHTSLLEDITIASERAQSARAMMAGERARQAVERWDVARSEAGSRRERDWRALDVDAAALNEQIDLLVNYTAGDGFAYRGEARAIVASDVRATLIYTATALLLAALVVFYMAKRIVGPVAAASDAAREIAGGRLDGVIPQGYGDELGALLAAMTVMRDNIRGMMEREVAQRRFAQTRLADALAGSDEGIAVVDASGAIVLANQRLATFLEISPKLLRAGTPADAVAAMLDTPALRSGAVLESDIPGPDDGEMRRIGDRWLRISRSPTQDGGFVAMVGDVTALKRQEERLRATNLGFDAALENMSQGLCLYDDRSRLVVVNRRFAEIYRLDPADVRPGISFREVIGLRSIAGHHGPCDLDELHDSRLEAIRRGGGAVLEELSDGRTIAIAHRGTADGGWVATYEDITERLAAERQITFLARHDALTRLPNRTVFAERGEEAVKRLGRGEGFAVLYLDLDRFKQINDTLGHAAGDALLRGVADRLEACAREVDTVCRFGGDEFAILQCGVARDEDAVVLAKRIVEVLRPPFDVGGRPVSAGVSIGIAVAPRDGSSFLALTRNADAALYRAKADGRGVWRCFEPEMDARLQARSALEVDLRRALVDAEFEVHYQPLHDLALDRFGGCEALVRWRHPSRGLVSPAEFIPVAEAIGLIVPLGEWVLRQACLDASSWPPHVKVAVNVSSAQFAQGRLVRAVEGALATSGLEPSRLELEITETALLSEADATKEALHALRRLGVRIAMDDFGTGYSSLSYLLSFPFDKIKIDQSFVRDLETRSEAGTLVRTMVQLGRSLGMRVTAEGVETERQLEQLRRDGCDEIQGYLFSRPVPVGEVQAMLTIGRTISV
ncbi:EAL domain-containing protein [Lichenibacterium dinghuense]|uniref:EAL domain-containing protein n=1 Tax=Lichenibacterium dinghuense TaxID=2895977 RepID=UPI001F340A2E|nr:EAL domain-containing protein [Lichenibacterium sp. 6Y81]